jgi:hypothetical protein
MNTLLIMVTVRLQEFTFDTAPESGAVIVILETDPVSGLELRYFKTCVEYRPPTE